jgi:UDP-N-acetylglucosamine--N-acetylmuramyl-(pentapeptide) pyrophosphoryl-undecaprenol N-acetylglucosamine transferase
MKHRLSSEHERPAGECARRFLVVAGGTGGHIAPALAVGEALRRSGEGAVVRYLTGSRQIERQAFEAASEFPDFLACERAPRVSLAGVPEMLRYLRSVEESWRLLRRFRPDAVLATGGYVCAPVLATARVLRIPYFLHESNAVPGQVTRWFARGARRVFVEHEAAARRLDAGVAAERVGTPVRRALFEARRADALERFGFEPDRPVLFVLGGSQGARGINEAMLEALPRVPSSLGLQVIWACGPLNHKTVSGLLERSALEGTRVSLHDFLDDVHLAYAAADLVLSRAGASTLAEISALGLPSILVPFPEAKDNHQWENARALAESGGAVVLDELSLTGERLAGELTELLGSEARREALARAARACGRPRCAEAIAAHLLGHEWPTESAVLATAHPIEKLTA